MSDKMTKPAGATRSVSRRDFLKASLGAGIGLGSTYLLACAAPAQPTPVPKPTPAAAVAAPTPAQAPQAPATPTVMVPKKVVFASNTGAVGGLHAIIKNKKIDLKHGVDIEFKTLEVAEAMMAVALRRVDVGGYAPISAATAINEGKPIVLFAPALWNNTNFIVAKDSPYTKVADLKGKKVTTLQKVSGVYTSTQIIFKEMGLDFEKDFQLVTAAIPVQIGLLERKEVDAAIFSDPWALRVIETGNFRELASANDLWKGITGQPMFFIGVGAHREWYEQNKDTTRRLLNCLIEGAKYVQEHPEAIEEIKDLLDLKTPREVELAMKRMPPFYAAQWDDNTFKNAELIIKRSAELKIIEQVPKEGVFVVP
ncbi:MAG: ABC transporter substrate-binding protein [Chloroflexi bacterium]|nr:ABC transporter substrate-binding protein [Chloroflexota bacterium]